MLRPSFPARSILSSAMTESRRAGGLWIVSNRLPVTVVRHGTEVDLRESPGGVSVGLAGLYRDLGARWIGWPGEMPEESARSVSRRLAADFACHAVFLPPRVVQDFYHGFSNRTLWPLFHSFQTYARYDPGQWAAYKAANAAFADAVVALAGPRDTIWVHDYQLLLLPQLLRERLPHASIGFFLHVPFPPYDILSALPWSREVVRGMLGADLVGFHTYDYQQAFLHAVRRLHGVDNEIGRLAWGSRLVQTDVFPMGVDVSRLVATEVPTAVHKAMEDVRAKAEGAKLAFSISRLDYTKGIPEALRAFEALFERHPECRGALTYVLAVVPSRERVDRYALLKKEVDELVGRINSRYGSLAWTPVRYVYRQLPFDELLALYRASDLAVVLPLRDGMNLVAKEYLVARRDASGVLVLSEMTGSAKELTEALVVNPNDTDGVVDALHAALRMPREEQVRRNRPMRERLKARDVRWWAERFLARLDETVELSRGLEVRMLQPKESRAIADRYAEAGHRLLLLDYDGTLVPFSDRPEEAEPTDEVLDALAALAATPRNRVVVISGRRQADLERFLGKLPLALVAEHGARVRDASKGGWRSTVALASDWMSRIRPVLDIFVDRVPGSWVEAKDFSLVWHYRRADLESGAAAAGELVDALTTLTANLDLHVLLGQQAVEVKSTRVSKGTFVREMLKSDVWDFVFAAGDDRTDESLFAALPSGAISIRVGLAISAARFNVTSPREVIDLLKRLTSATEAA